MVFVALPVSPARAGAPDPEGLEGLVALALERHPEVAALGFDADAARARARAAGRPMDAQWMLGAEGLGAMPDSADPPMFMVGVEQMISVPSTYRASRKRAALDVRWAEGERARLEADVREGLWETAARLRAQSAQGAALDEQIAAAEAALAFGRARYAAGAGSSASSPPSAATSPEESPVRAPTVRPPTPAGGGMRGMGGELPRGAPEMQGMGERGGMVGRGGMAEQGGMAGMGGGMSGMSGGGMRAPMGPEGLAALLRLEAEVARARADRDALVARHAGEVARLTLLVGDEAARLVAAEPARFLGASGSAEPPLDARGTAPEPPERGLAATSLALAEADASVARAGRLPTFMVATDVRVMPDGMVDGLNARLGVTVPLWGGARARVQEATASAAAAARRSDLVDRALADAIAAAQAEEYAAEARERALSEVAVPRARAAWEATVAVWGAGGGTAEDVVAAWQTTVGVLRDAADAALATELARARIARLEGR